MQYEIRELSLGEVLDQAIKILRNHLGILCGIAAIYSAPFALLYFNFQTSIPKVAPNAPLQEQTKAVESAQGALIVYMIGLSLLGLLVFPLVNAAINNAIASRYLGRPLSFGECMTRSFRLYFPLILTTVLFGLAYTLGFFVFCIGAVIAALWFGLFVQVVVIEGTWGVAALSRSKELMSGNMGTAFVLGILVGVIQGGISFMTGLVPVPAISALLNIVLGAANVAFGSAVWVVFYFSCRCKHENFDLEMLEQSVQAD